MDLVCTRCGEPWDMHHVLHDEPAAFRRKGSVIRRCPACPPQMPDLCRADRARLDAIRALGELLGDDVDALAAVLEDFDLL